MKIMTIAGFDPSNNAGILKDMETFARYGCRAAGVVTAITFQNEHEFFSFHSLVPEQVLGQIEAVRKGNKIEFIKIGLIGSQEITEALAGYISSSRESDGIFVVCDPVHSASAGKTITGDEGLKSFKKFMPGAVDLLTPNIDEVEILTGLRPADHDSMKEAALELASAGFRNSYIKGGHLAGNPDDLLYSDGNFRFFTGYERIPV
ncbi:MAG: bifunctional hydroxymethylpyrimidine kinase/phosphomethylpyrimidine kinase, partial [Deltaproteobacteria bacterium]|nr:bifunctional hydroxymethylpyrimidine kinase/phosphomethylpyrimidine kinase [Deltaproteobacteria bacterium]